MTSQQRYFLPPWVYACRARPVARVEWEEDPQRRALKRHLHALRTSPSSYLRPGLRSNEWEAFHAASAVCWWRTRSGRTRLLLAYERRPARQGTRCALNLLGGKRDALDESPVDVVRREIAEETGGLLHVHPRRDDAKLWHAPSKQVIFLLRVDDASRIIQQSHDYGAPPEGLAPHCILTLTSVDLQVLDDLDWRKTHLHYFAHSMLEEIRHLLR